MSLLSGLSMIASVRQWNIGTTKLIELRNQAEDYLEEHPQLLALTHDNGADDDEDDDCPF